jgi:chemotaxis protein CheX
MQRAHYRHQRSPEIGRGKRRLSKGSIMQSVAHSTAPSGQAPRPTLDVKLIAPFVESVRTVLRTMVNVETTVQKPYLKTSAGQYNVFGIIGFSGDLTGNVTVSFTRSSAAKLVEAFTGSSIEPDSPHFADAIGELANMIAGSAKSKLGLDARITVPSVVMGDSCHMATLTGMPCVVIPCTSALGDFAIEVAIKQNKSI